MDSSNPLSILIETNRLTGPNLHDWLRNLRIVLSVEKIDYALDNLPLKAVQEGANEEDKIAYSKWRNDDKKARCYMLASMNNELQKQHFNTESAYEILIKLQEMYADLSVNRFRISKKLFTMRMSMGSSVNDHVLEMISYIQQLEKLGSCMCKELAKDLILQSLPKSYSKFIMDSDLIIGDYDFSGLLDRLISAETNMKKTKCTLLDSRKSFISKTKLKCKVKVKKAQSKSVKKAHLEVKASTKKALLEVKASTKKAHLKPKGGIKKAHLKLKGFVAKAQLNLESSVKKSESRDADGKGKCFRCGKGHLKKGCNKDVVSFKQVSVEENSDDWHIWKKPDLGWIKLNTDGCLKGFGGLFRDHEGKPLSAYVVRGGIIHSFTAELLAVLKGISLAYLRGIKCLWVESDCMCVVKAIRREQPCPPVVALYLDHILQLIGLFEKFTISHSWRECNQAADLLSRMDIRVNDGLVKDFVLTPDDFPESLWKIIKDDAGGRLYYRRTSRSTCLVEERI